MSSNSTSPTARKLLTKLSPLLSAPSQSSSSFSETQQTIASWMIFNRKKKDALSEGMNVAIRDALSMDENNNNRADRLLVLLKVVNRVLVTNCPGLSEGCADASIWDKSVALRQALVEAVVTNLLGELANCVSDGSPVISQVDEMIKTWEEHNVCDGSVIWGDLRQKWEDGMAQKSEDSQVAPESTPVVPVHESAERPESVANDGKEKNDKDVAMNEASVDDTSAFAPGNNEQTAEESKSTEEAKVDVSENKEEEKSSPPNDTRRKLSRQDSAMSTTSVASVGDIDYEGVEEAQVEPHRLLEAAKVIAQLQITRDIGGDTAMNLSAVFGHIPTEVEEACQAMTRQSDGEGDGEDSKEERVKILSKLPDDFLDLDLKYAKQSLQTYKEAIRQQKRARLQCLHLLLQSRCSFGSMDAARILFGSEKSGGDADDETDNAGETSTLNINSILDKLKKRKEALSDALALEGLDVEEDAEEEKKLEKEEKDVVPFSWFVEEEESDVKEDEATIGKTDEDVDDGPVAKKLKCASPPIST